MRRKTNSQPASANTLLRVDAVIVPLYQSGFGFAHSPAGECFRFTGPRDKMIALCDRVKTSSEKSGPEVCIDPREWHDVSVIENPDDCWVHPFVERPASAA